MLTHDLKKCFCKQEREDTLDGIDRKSHAPLKAYKVGRLHVQTLLGLQSETKAQATQREPVSK